MQIFSDSSWVHLTDVGVT